MTRTRRVLATLLVVGALAAQPGTASLAIPRADHASVSFQANAPSAAGPREVAGAAATGSASLAQLVGQKLMVAMSGTTPSADLLGRIERGEVGGVILFSFNISTAGKLRALTEQAGPGRGGRRPAPATDRDRPGGWPGGAGGLGTTDAVAA